MLNFTIPHHTTGHSPSHGRYSITVVFCSCYDADHQLLIYYKYILHNAIAYREMNMKSIQCDVSFLFSLSFKREVT